MNETILQNEGIRFKDIKAAVNKIAASKEIELQEKQLNERAELEAKQFALQIDGQKQFLDLQRDWAAHIKWQIWAVLAFQFIFIFFVGFNLGHFTDNINKIPYMFVGVILQNLANIAALGFVVARFLFPQVPKINKN